MAEHSRSGSDWSSVEVDLIVADYFSMLEMELLGRPYVKAHRNEEMQKLIGRSRGSIEYKHQNVSAVLDLLGMPWVPGYKPMSNFQKSLVDGIDRYLSANPTVFEQSVENSPFALHEKSTSLFLESPPTLVEQTSEPRALQRLVRKFDPAARDERNRKLGKQGEELVIQHEFSRLKAAGRDDLARRVRWVSEEDGDGAGYDILSFGLAGDERLLEVKTTRGKQRTPFYLSENERVLSSERPDAFRLMRVYDFGTSAKAFELIPPLEGSVILRPASYRASF